MAHCSNFLFLQGFNWRLKIPEAPSLGAALAAEDVHGAQHERVNTSLATQVVLRGSGLQDGTCAVWAQLVFFSCFSFR